VFAVLFAKSLGFTVDHSIFKDNSAYMRNALVWASLGIYSRYEYIDRIFFDAILHVSVESSVLTSSNTEKYSTIGDYNLKDYKEQQHEHLEDEK
jgi:cell filamentation protein